MSECPSAERGFTAKLPDGEVGDAGGVQGHWSCSPRAVSKGREGQAVIDKAVHPRCDARCVCLPAACLKGKDHESQPYAGPDSKLFIISTK